MKPDPDFEDFARDYVRLARQEKSLQRRARLLVWRESGCMPQCRTGRSNLSAVAVR
jgi:hypothetical protein